MLIPDIGCQKIFKLDGFVPWKFKDDKLQSKILCNQLNTSFKLYKI